MKLYTLLKSWLFLHPGVSFSLSLGFIIQNILIIGILIGYAVDKRGKRNQLEIDVERYHYYKKQAESLEKYRNAAGKMEFYKKEAELKNHDNIRLRRKIGAIINISGEEL